MPPKQVTFLLQDVFDAGLVLGDTDYRQLSYRHRGGLPGIDIAYLLSGAAYHTDRDTLDAIRPGVLQVGCCMGLYP